MNLSSCFQELAEALYSAVTEGLLPDYTKIQKILKVPVNGRGKLYLNSFANLSLISVKPQVQ